MMWATHISLLFFKNWKIKRRSWIFMLSEITVPIILALCAVLARIQVDNYETVFSTVEKPDRLEKYLRSIELESNFTHKYIAYAPNLKPVNRIMNLLYEELDNLLQNGTVAPKGFRTKDDAYQYIEENRNVTILIIISPQNKEDTLDNTTLPTNLNMTLRPVHEGTTEGTAFLYYFPPRNTPQCAQPRYTDITFLTHTLMFKAVTRYWLEQQNRDPDNLKWNPSTRCMPWPPYSFDPLVDAQVKILPMVVIASFLITVIALTRVLVTEKESKLKEVLKMMGVRQFAYWMSYLLTVQSYLIPIICLYTFLFSVKFSQESEQTEDNPYCRLSPAGAIIGKTSSSVFLVFLILYGLAITTYCFMVSSFVRRANIGAVSAGIVFFVLYIPYINVRMNYQHLSKVEKLASCLSCNVAMSLGIYLISIRGGSSEPGITWMNVMEPLGGDDFTMAECMLMLLVDAFLHCIIAWYVDQVLPAETGVAKHPLFFLQWSYWSPKHIKANPHLTQSDFDLDPQFFEEIPTNLTPGIQIQNLRKVFGHTVCVRGTSLDMFEGQITVLLGHNGAGKTVTMGMLTGFIKPTNGTAVINGYDIRTDLDDVREGLGVCPQFNVLYPNLTCIEHLHFFASLKGCSGSKMREDCMDRIREVGLEGKKHDLAMTLSGGQKRKLSVAIALVGGSKVVILDEPTAGMDPAARRQTWHVLKNARQGRTILLTTHYMDEADMLGDRIAIMARGVIECCGSSMFLKKQYGNGYHLIVNTEPGCDINKLYEAVQHCVPGASLQAIVRTEITVILPECDVQLFPDLFNELEKSKAELKINNFGLGTTSMEEVFLKVEYVRDEIGDMVLEPERKLSMAKNSLMTFPRPHEVGPSGTQIDQVYNRTFAGNDAKKNRQSLVMKLANKALEMNRYSIANVDDTKSVQSRNRSSDETVKSILKAADGQSQRSSQAPSTKSTGTVKQNMEGNNKTQNNAANPKADVSTTKIRASRSEPVDAKEDESRISISQTIRSASLAEIEPEAQLLTGCRYGFTIFCALMEKKFIVAKRSWLSFLGQTLLPFLIVLFLFESDTPRFKPSMGKLVYNFARYERIMVPYETTGGMHSRRRTLAKIYADLFKDEKNVVLMPVDMTNRSLDDYILMKISTLGHPVISKQMAIGMSLTNDYSSRRPPNSSINTEDNNSQPTAYFNDYVRHSRRIAMNYLLNAMMEQELHHSRENNTFHIQTILHGYPLPPDPFKPTASQGKRDISPAKAILNAYSFGLALGIGMPFSVIQSLQCVLLEKKEGSKHMQYLSGAGPLAYWGTHLLFDFFNYCLSAGTVLAAFFIYPDDAFIKHWDALAVLLLSYGWVSIWCIYMLQFFFRSPAGGAAFFISYSIISGSLATIAMLLFNSFGLTNDIQMGDARGSQGWISFFVPTFNLMQGVMNMHYNYYNEFNCGWRNCSSIPINNDWALHCCPNPCNDFCYNYQDSIYAWENPGIGSFIAYMVIQGLIFLLVVVLLDNRLFHIFVHSIKGKWWVGQRSKTFDPSGEDEDVALERKRILSKSVDELRKKDPDLDRVTLANLYKCYGELVAVEHLCLGVDKGECFGLLGQNGAGKTTTFKTISGDKLITSGEAYVMGFMVSIETKQVQNTIGYCPQFEGLILKMTGREALNMFARLRGIPSKTIPKVVDNLFYLLNFEPHADIISGYYSGGIKRKLNVAISLIGDPQVILLDEPSWGMDPKARRHLWNVLSARRQDGTTMLLTSHSMEECEALCTRMSIMVAGRFMCLGSVQHLKSKYGDGYTFIIQLSTLPDGSPAPNKPVIHFFEKRVQDSELFDLHQNYLHFRAPDKPGRLGSIFQLLESVKGAMHIADYSVQQTSLEQVFLSFTREQVSPSTDPSRAWINRLKLGGVQSKIHETISKFDVDLGNFGKREYSENFRPNNETNKMDSDEKTRYDKTRQK